MIPAAGGGPPPVPAAAAWQPVARVRTYQQVIDRIVEQITVGALRVGDHLPAERDLAAALGVSRTAVREAVRVLEARGVVRSGTGSGPESGTVVTALQSEALTELITLHVALTTVGVADLVRARVALERESTRLACSAATPADHADLRRVLDAMDETGSDIEAFSDLDAAFHIRIARAGGNSLVADLTTALRTIMRPRLLESLTASSGSPAELTAILARLRHEHRGIHTAILRGAAAEAADLVESHIAGFYSSAPPHPHLARVPTLQP